MADPLRLILVRHGESHSNAAWPAVALHDHEGDRLTERGERQAQELADAMAAGETGARRLIASNLNRAQGTAAPIGRALGLEVETLELVRELREGHDFPDLAPELQRLRRWSSWMSANETQPDWAPSGADSFDGFRERIRDFKERAVSICAEAGGPVIVVTHGIFLRFLLFDSLLGDAFGPEHTPRMWLIRTRNCGVSIFEHVTADPADVAYANTDWSCLSWMEPTWTGR